MENPHLTPRDTASSSSSDSASVLVSASGIALIEKYRQIDACGPLTPWCHDPSYSNTDHYDRHPEARAEVLEQIFAHLAAVEAERQQLQETLERERELDHEICTRAAEAEASLARLRAGLETLTPGIMAIVEGAYRRDTLAPAYIHLVRADIAAFIAAVLASDTPTP